MALRKKYMALIVAGLFYTSTVQAAAGEREDESHGWDKLSAPGLFTNIDLSLNKALIDDCEHFLACVFNHLKRFGFYYRI